MKRISVEKYLEGVNSIYVEQPTYRTGGDGSDGTCDCIGMCSGALERGGVTDVKNMRGTNAAARGTIEDLQLIGYAKDLKCGDVVLKTRDKDDKSMPLPDRYRKGKADYDPKWGETNFTHIGTVTSVNPLEITHMTSPTAKKDTKIGNWKYRGWLPWVEKDSGEQDPPWDDGQGTEWAIVIAENGCTVKMRAKPSTSCRLYWDVPVGASVIIEEYGPQWSKITWAGQSGYMMSKFLLMGGGTIKETTYKVIITGLDLTQAKALINNYPGSIMEEEYT